MRDYSIENFKHIAEVEELQKSIQAERKQALTQRRKIKKLKLEIIESEIAQEELIKRLDDQLAKLSDLHSQFNQHIQADGKS